MACRSNDHHPPAPAHDLARSTPAGRTVPHCDVPPGDEHARAVEEYAGKIIQESRARLSPEELYLLLHAIYTHDAGYRRDAKDHPQHSRDLIVKHAAEFFVYDPHLADAIGWLCAAHGISDISKVPNAFSVDFLSRTEEFDLRFLGSVLLLADERDQGYLRVFNTRGQEWSARNEVYHVEIGPQIVKIKTKPQSENEYNQLQTVARGIQERLNNVREIVATRGIMLEQIALYPTIWASHEKVPSRPEPRATWREKGVLFILDRTVLGMQIFQEFKSQQYPVVSLPTMLMDREEMKTVLATEYACIVWVLGEDFGTHVPRTILSSVIDHTRTGGGLVLFPFVAWSVAQGINDLVEDVLPVALSGNWWEGSRQNVTQFESHPITRDIQAFSLQNTFEALSVKGDATCIIADDNSNPVLVLGQYGLGQVAYANVSSHLCMLPGTMPSPWDQDESVRRIVKRTIDWVSRDSLVRQ